MTEPVVNAWPPAPGAKIACLGPMVRANSTPLRVLALDYGADVVYSEELIARRVEVTERRENDALGTVDWLDKGGKSVCLRADPAREKGRLVVQLGASDGACAARAAATVADVAAGVDLNMGCPKPFSAGQGMGQALLKDPARAASIVKELRRTLPEAVAVSCKIRMLGDAGAPDEAATADLCRALESAGARAIAVHCRYAGDDPPKTPARQAEMRSLFARLRDETPAFRERCALLANGDFYTTDAVQACCAGAGGADGVLVARPALLDPSRVFGGPAKPKADVLTDYLDLADRYDTHYKNTKYVVMEMLAQRRHPAAARAAHKQREGPPPAYLTVAAFTPAKSRGDLRAVLNRGRVGDAAPSDALGDGRAYSDDYFRGEVAKRRREDE